MKIYNEEFMMKEHSMKEFYDEGSFNEGVLQWRVIQWSTLHWMTLYDEGSFNEESWSLLDEGLFNVKWPHKVFVWVTSRSWPGHDRAGTDADWKEAATHCAAMVEAMCHDSTFLKVKKTLCDQHKIMPPLSHPERYLLDSSISINIKQWPSTYLLTPQAEMTTLNS